MRLARLAMLIGLVFLLSVLGIACGSGSSDDPAPSGAPATAPAEVPPPTQAPPTSVPPTPTAVPVPTTAAPVDTPTPVSAVEPPPTLEPTPTSIPAPTATPEPVQAAVEPTSEPTPVPVDLDEAPTPPDVIGLVARGQIPAPFTTGLDGWINSEALTSSDFFGNIVLLDFWTYTCVNCIRTLPYLREWHEKYADLGLIIVGVHTPEFEFEKIHENVAAATADLGIEYPVAQDNDRLTWNTYRVQAWPSKYIIDGSGFVRYFHRGEGSYADTEAVIRYLLEEAGTSVEHIEHNTDPDPVRTAGTRSTDPELLQTRELYGGSRRNIDFGGAYVVNEEYYESAGIVQEYTDPGERKNHFLFLQGSWLAGPESLAHAGDSEPYEDYLGIKFFANEVNAVMNLESGEPYRFRVTFDGGPIPESAAGSDVTYDDQGNSIVEVDSARMYRLVRQSEVTSHELLLRPEDDRFDLYSFTFGTYALDE